MVEISPETTELTLLKLHKEEPSPIAEVFEGAFSHVLLALSCPKRIGVKKRIEMRAPLIIGNLKGREKAKFECKGNARGREAETREIIEPGLLPRADSD